MEMSVSALGHRLSQQYDFVELMYYGKLAILDIGSKDWRITSPDREKTMDFGKGCALPRAVIVGWWQPARKGQARQQSTSVFHAFDILSGCWDEIGKDVSELCLVQRRATLCYLMHRERIGIVDQLDWLRMSKTYKTGEWKSLWKDKVEKGFSGLMFRRQGIGEAFDIGLMERADLMERTQNA